MNKLKARLSASWYRIICLIRKEFWQLQHDLVFSCLLIALPLFLLVLVVNVMHQGTSSVNPLAVVDYDVSASSRRLITAIVNTGSVRIKLATDSLEEASAALRAGNVAGMVVIPAGFERDLAVPQRQIELLAVVDGTNVWSSQSTLTAISGAIQRFTEDNAQTLGYGASIELRPSRYDNIQRIHDPIASMFGLLLCETIFLVAGMGLARERETGTLEQLLVTPLNRFELLLGKTMPALLVGIADFWVLWLAGRLIWAMPMRGSLALLFGLAILYILAESAWGLFLSAQAADQQQATQLIFVQILVELSLCGYIVPVSNLPVVLRWIAELLPLRHYLDCIRVIVLRGGGLSDVAGSLAALLALNVAFWFISSRVLRRKLG